MDEIHRKQYGSKSNAYQGGAAASTSSGKRKGKGGTVRGGGKKPPIKVVYIGNPMRVTTSAAGFRALVQELTGRHADPYKHGGAIDADGAADDSISGGGSPAGPLQAGGALPSPVSTPSSDAASAAGAAHASSSAPAYYDGDEEDSFAPQLIDNSYCVFSPPTFLYGPHGGEL
ncbi:unnamed protein product [Urochloa decumbens]|uniref:VQ domain-containing protein n=1 Tax=Urochloa decumbens TaxID=240449 RepID=A0ABC8WFB1_9POAL